MLYPEPNTPDSNTSLIVASIDTFTAFIFLLFSTFSDVEKKTGNEISADHAYRILSWR